MVDLRRAVAGGKRDVVDVFVNVGVEEDFLGEGGLEFAGEAFEEGAKCHSLCNPLFLSKLHETRLHAGKSRSYPNVALSGGHNKALIFNYFLSYAVSTCDKERAPERTHLH